MLGRAPVGAKRTSPVDRLLALSSARSLVGPFVQVGDRAAAVLWRDARGRPYTVRIDDLWTALTRPGELQHSTLDSGLIRSRGWSPASTLEQGLRETYDYIAKQRAEAAE